MKRQKIRKIIMTVSLFLFPVIFFYFSPYIILFSSQMGIINGSFIMFIILFLFSLFLGRLWCGWLCSGGGIEEACARLQKRRVSPWVDKIKYVIWVVWIGLIAWLAIQAGGYKKVDFFIATTNGISLADQHSWNVFLIVVGSILVITFLAGKRGFCHAACWMAPFMVIGRRIGNFFKWPRLRLEAEREKCNNCLACTRSCPMSLPVNDMVQKGNMENSECILCGTCADSCLKKVIRYRFKRDN